MNLANVKRKVKQFGTNMKQLWQQASGQFVPGHFVVGPSWTYKMTRGTGSGVPYALPASIAMSADLGEQSDFCRMARENTGVAELVDIMERQPWISVETLGTFAKQRAGELFERQPWSVAKLTKEQVA